ncbi:MAG: hypothetical protein ACI81V_000097 [Lentimonas sp.]
MQALTNPSLSTSLINLVSPEGAGYNPIVSISARDYSVTVTVRDYVEFGTAGTRYMRLRINIVP